MMQNRLSCLLVAGLLALAASACEETRFATPPGTDLADCDPAWKGLWLGDDTSDERPEGIYVDAQCRLSVIETESPGATPKRTPIALRYATIAGKRYVVAAQSALKPLFDLPPPYAIDPPPGDAYFLARYRVSADRIELFRVDNAKVAKLVIDGKLDGTVSKTDNELHVFVRTNAAGLVDLLRRENIFTDTPGIVALRSHLDIDALPHAERSGPPREDE
ncbi:MAG: hypothetical protein WB784_11035 [Rhodanobacteraceae bacterium]